jgi:hypothetical protein
MQIRWIGSLALAAMLVLSACAQNNSRPVVENTLPHLGCEGFRDALFEGVQVYLMEHNQAPLAESLNQAVSDSVRTRFEGKVSRENLRNLSEKIADFYVFMIQEVSQTANTKDALTLKTTLGALKVGDRSTPVAAALQKRIEEKLNAIQKIVSEENIPCNETSPPEHVPSDSQNDALKAKVPLIILGSRKAMATAYQSCESLDLEPMTRAVPPVQGVEVIGVSPDGNGKIRKITNQAALARTHYYIKNFTANATCKDVRKYSLIYDYGGKPYASTSPTSPLNFWKNTSGGSPGLGIDCSGYVFSAVAAGGLRLRAGKPLKALEVQDYPARMYMNPGNNGFSCLAKAAFGKNLDLKAGDIVATDDHIVLVEKIGRDPLAIRKYANCENITYKDFDFTITQSSPEQNAIGINRYIASEYLAQKSTNSSMFSGFRDYAIAACKAYQAGKDTFISSSKMSIVRHKMTADCLQNEIPLEGESCIDSCRELLD